MQKWLFNTVPARLNFGANLALKNMATPTGSQSNNIANSLSHAITALISLRSVLSDAELPVSLRYARIFLFDQLVFIL